MEDRELLELAALAGGYELAGTVAQHVVQPGHYEGGFIRRNEIGGDSMWNPLTDDGDALRLAVKLGMRIERHYFDGDYFVKVSAPGQSAAKTESIANDTYAATRRAIVRAAAEIGKRCTGVCDAG